MQAPHRALPGAKSGSPQSVMSKSYNIEPFLNKISQKYTSFYGYLPKLLQGTPRLGIFPTYELMKGF